MKSIKWVLILSREEDLEEFRRISVSQKWDQEFLRFVNSFPVQSVISPFIPESASTHISIHPLCVLIIYNHLSLPQSSWKSVFQGKQQCLNKDSEKFRGCAALTSSYGQRKYGDPQGFQEAEEQALLLPSSPPHSLLPITFIPPSTT